MDLYIKNKVKEKYISTPDPHPKPLFDTIKSKPYNINNDIKINKTQMESINCCADNWGDQLSSGIIYTTIDTEPSCSNNSKELDQPNSFCKNSNHQSTITNMNLSTSIEKDITSIDSIVEEFSRIKEEIKAFGIYVDPFITI